MNKAYLIGQITITNPQGYQAYASRVPETIANFGGKYLVRGGHSTQVEGQAQGERTVVLEFPSRQAAENWYNSESYQEIVKYRTENSIGHLAIVDAYMS